MNSTAHSSVADVVRAHSVANPDRVALIVEGGGVRPDVVRTYAALWANAQALARCLQDRGAGPGSVFGILMANHVEFVELMIAAALTSCVFVPIDPRTKGDKLAFMLRNAGVEGVFSADYALPNLEEVLEQVPQVRWLIAIPTEEGPGRALWSPMAEEFSACLEVGGQESLPPTVDPDSAMQIIHTSGTTGEPKGIVVTHRRFCATAEAALKLFGYTSQDRLYSGLSLTHANAQLVTLGAALFGGMTAVLSRRFTKSRLWDITRKYQCTTFTLLGGMTTALYAQPPGTDDADNPVRFVVSAGMPAALWKNFEQRFGVRILEFYGSAEGGLAVNPIDAGPIGSCGRVAPGLIYRIVDEKGQDVPKGSPGELLLRPADGTPFLIEYVGNPEASRAKGKDGWLHMGDVVREDGEGWLFFEYRKGGGIRRNGDFISAAFVEKVIAESGSVEDVFVYGVPATSGAPGDKDVVAAIVPHGGAAFDAQGLFRHCRRNLEANFVPSFIQVVPQIPKTASEKPQERFLIDALHKFRGQVYLECPEPTTFSSSAHEESGHESLSKDNR